MLLEVRLIGKTVVPAAPAPLPRRLPGLESFAEKRRTAVGTASP
jgi:hypothetical protein